MDVALIEELEMQIRILDRMIRQEPSKNPEILRRWKARILWLENRLALEEGK